MLHSKVQLSLEVIELGLKLNRSSSNCIDLHGNTFKTCVVGTWHLMFSKMFLQENMTRRCDNRGIHGAVPPQENPKKVSQVTCVLFKLV